MKVMNMTYEAALELIQSWKMQGEQIVLATGVFDILHVEHIRFLTAAAERGTKLAVGVECDVRVQAVKGTERPVNPQDIRIEQLASLRVVDIAFVLPETFASQSDWEQFMEAVSPAVYAVSSHTSWLENKRAIAEAYGAEFAIVREFNPDYSTSALHRRMLAEE